MFTTRSELLEKIRLGEDNFLKLKEVRFAGEKISGPKRDDLADELAAFANGSGGVLLLGVDDKTREVLGIPVDRLDMVEALVREVCEDSIKPSGTPAIERINLPDNNGIDRPVIRVLITPSPFVHESPGGYFRRIGSLKRPIPPDQLARLFQQRSQTGFIRFDETPVHHATLADLDEALWKRFAAPRSANEPEQLMMKLAMARQDEAGVWRPTVAGVLMACREPRQFLHNAFIQAVAYRGKTTSPQPESVYQRGAQNITGPLDQQIYEACDFIRKNMQVAARKGSSGGREDIPQFDMLAVFEAIVNAAAHRDYSMWGSKVRLHLFDDRIELYTPGPLVNTMTTESLPYRQASRNKVITSLLAYCPVSQDDFRSHRTHIMDKRGEGVKIILDRSERLSGKVPEYRLLDESELLLTIYAADVSEVGV